MVSEAAAGRVEDKATRAPAMPLVLWRALRPRQWVKNGVLLAGILFTLDRGHDAADWLRVAVAIALFCLLSSAVYLINDTFDIDQDRLHPLKRLRPVAAGWLGIGSARTMAAMLAAAGMTGSLLLGPWFALTAALYVALTLGYTLWLKHEVILDVLALAACYVVRAAAGAVAVNVEISPWLLVCTTLGALLVGLSKRRSELVTLEDAGSHRKTLDEYSVPMLDQMIGVATAGTLIAYMLYTFFSPTGQNRPLLMLTIPFVVYGILRFLYLVHRHGKGGDPSAELVEDRKLVLCGVLWALTCAAVIAFSKSIGSG